MNVLAKESYYQTWNLQKISKKKCPTLLQMKYLLCGTTWFVYKSKNIEPFVPNALENIHLTFGK